MDERSAVEQQLVLPVSPDELWADLTDPEEVASWFGATVEWELVPGGGARFVDDDGTERAGVIETVRPGRELRFRWWSPDERPTEVHYALEEVDGGTKLTVIERELPDSSDEQDDTGEPEAPVARAALSSAGWIGWGTRMAALWLLCRQPILV